MNLLNSKKRVISCVLLLVVVRFTAAGTVFPEKITAEELVAKHLESIGSAQIRAETKSHIIQGSVVATVRIGGSGQSKGGAVMASEGKMSLIGMIFGLQEYTNEKAAYDGKKLKLGEWRPGVRTNLGGFFLNHDVIFREGLFGGALSTAWPLLDVAARNPKLRYLGDECHDIGYRKECHDIVHSSLKKLPVVGRDV